MTDPLSNACKCDINPWCPQHGSEVRKQTSAPSKDVKRRTKILADDPQLNRIAGRNLLEAGPYQIDPTDVSILLSTIDRLNWDLIVQRGVNDLAYIPHRSLAEDNDRYRKARDHYRAALTEIAAGGWNDAVEPTALAKAALQGETPAKSAPALCTIKPWCVREDGHTGHCMDGRP